MVPKIADVWFPRREKNIALTFGFSSFFFGCMLSFTIPYLFDFSYDDIRDPNKRQDISNKVQLLFFIIFSS